MASKVSQIPNRFFTSFTADKAFTVHKRKADVCEYLGEGCMSLLSAAFSGRPPVKVTKCTFDIKEPRYWLTRVAIGIFAIATAPLLLIPGLIFLGLSKTHKVAYFATLAEAHRKDGEHARARKWMICALRVNHKQRWLSDWVENYNWSQKRNNNKKESNHDKVGSDVRTLLRFAKFTNSDDLLGVCQKIFNEALVDAIREGDSSFKKLIKGCKGLPITKVKVENMSLDQAMRLKNVLPFLGKVEWCTSEQDKEDRSTVLRHLAFAAHYNNKAKRAELQNMVQDNLAKGAWSLKDVAYAPLKTLDLSTLKPNKLQLKLFLDLPQLEVLTIDGGNLEADDLRLLAPLAKLNKLTVKNMQGLTKEKLAELKNVLPNTEVSA